MIQHHQGYAASTLAVAFLTVAGRHCHNGKDAALWISAIERQKAWVMDRGGEMRSLVVFALVVLISACTRTAEMQLAPNVVRLDTQSSGLLFVDGAGDATLKRAAEVTLANGYTHFRLEQASMQQGNRLAGVSSQSQAQATVTSIGNTAYGSGFGTGFATPVYTPTANIGVTVVMFRAGEPGAESAFDAAEVLRRIRR
jgi:hypothetical protein